MADIELPDLPVTSEDELEATRSEESEVESEDESDVSASADVSKLTLAASFEEKVRPFIDLIDELRRHGLEQDISLPSVIVIGDQSSGKSSILEAISGIKLPRGSGIVTRCPLEMQLKKSRSSKTPWKARLSYRTIAREAKDHDVNDPSLVEDYIRNAQDEIAGNKKGISSNLITLKVESPACPDLTLIDLPGIARTAVEGQPHDICQQIKALLRDYAEKSHTIMLCVLPANVDIAVNEALSLAQEFDSDGIRTLGVLTKPDLVDTGAEADVVAILNNEKVFLKKGYNIVRCRGQQDIIDGIDLEESLRQEERFFTGHRVFKKVDPQLKGTAKLAEKLTENLVEHIENTLPTLREEVRVQLEETRMRLNSMADGPPSEEAEKRLYLMRLLDRFWMRVKSAVQEGTKLPKRIFDYSRELKTELANTAYGWRRHFENLKQTVDRLTKASLQHGALEVSSIQHKMDSYRGRELPRFINFELFECLVQEHLEQYEQHIVQCLEKSSRDVSITVEYVAEECLSHVPHVKGHVRGICEEVREECKEDGKRYLKLEMKKEKLVYTQDPTYVEQLQVLQNKLQEIAEKSSNRKRRSVSFQVTGDDDEDEAYHNAIVMQQLLQVYLDVANRRILDNVPMLIRTIQHYEFVDRLKESLQHTASGNKVNDLVQEDARTKSERQRLQEKSKRLSNAMKMLNYV